MTSFKSRVRALLHGIALGDAMGAPVEKLSAAEIRTRYGRVTSLATEWHKANAARGRSATTASAATASSPTTR